MDVGWYYRILFLLISLIFSAFFSGSEVALFSIEKKLLGDRKKKNIIEDYLGSLLDAPRRLLVTILLGNTIFNVLASILSVSVAIDLANKMGWTIDYVLVVQIILLTIVVLILGEITPKVWAAKYPMQFARVVAIPLYWVSVLIFPVAKIITDVIKFFVSRIKFDKSKTALLSSELTDLAEIGVEKGSLEEEEQDLIHGIVSFKTVMAREVMTPRVDVNAVSLSASYDEVVSLIRESGHSRIPLFDENLDNIIGIIYAKDLLPFIGDAEAVNGFSTSKIAREALFVPETKLISDLLHEFQEKNMHMGIVVDEYGGTSGIVSMEDILEEIVGDIRDEYDNEESEIVKLDENKYSLIGKVPIDELNELFEYDFSSENDDYDTIGGFIYNHAGNIPEEGYSFEYDVFKFKVVEVDNKRINKIVVERIISMENEED